MSSTTPNSPDEYPTGKLELARQAGAHDQFLAFVAEYPDSRVANTLDTAISLDSLDQFENIAGSFTTSLWKHGVSKCSNADPENAEKLRSLFDEEELPGVLRE